MPMQLQIEYLLTTDNDKFYTYKLHTKQTVYLQIMYNSKLYTYINCRSIQLQIAHTLHSVKSYIHCSYINLNSSYINLHFSYISPHFSYIKLH